MIPTPWERLVRMAYGAEELTSGHEAKAEESPIAPQSDEQTDRILENYVPPQGDRE